MENQKNILAAIVLAAVVLFGWQYAIDFFYPARPASIDDKVAEAGTVPDPGTPAATPATAVRPVGQALSGSPRIAIKAPRVEGSINLQGGRIDDLLLTDHRQKIEKDSPPVRLFSPEGTATQHFAQFVWVGEGVTVPGPDAIWTPDVQALTLTTPVTLRWNNPQGQRFAIRYSIDKNYMITAEQSFANTGSGSVAVQPVGVIKRTSQNADPSTYNVHTGPIGAFDGAADYDWNYKDVAKEQNGIANLGGNVGWAGFTDIYWLSALIPTSEAQREQSRVRFRSLGNDLFQTELQGDKKIVAAGKVLTTKTWLFAGGKETNILEDYQDALGIPAFDRAIDWGWFVWFEKPIFYLLHWLFVNIGNFGLAIIALVFIIRGLMFPIAQKQFASMAQMRAIQPKMKAIQERHKEDKQKQQQEIMALYKSEKANPLAGCLPMFLQIPVFFALYKVLRLTIEMRHQPFALWIRDLSAPDPLTPVNLFGLLPFHPPAFLAIGILPILVGVTMWLQFKLNPAPADPVQQQVFGIMPWILMFVMAPFAAGLQLYWAVSNTLTILQQKWLYSKHPKLKEMAIRDAEERAAKKAAEAKAKG